MKTITNEQYYHALALYIIARHKQAEVDQLEKEANSIIANESDMGSHVSDAIYTYGNQGTQDEFDEALKKMDVAVEKV